MERYAWNGAIQARLAADAKSKQDGVLHLGNDTLSLFRQLELPPSIRFRYNIESRTLIFGVPSSTLPERGKGQACGPDEWAA